MAYKVGRDRDQMSFGICLDDFVGEDNACRVIDAFCEKLDTKKLGFKYAETADEGRPPFDPKALLKLFIYGYLNRINSSGKLALEATRNVEAMWLLNGLQPSKRTLCYFRENNKEGLKQVFREFNGIYRKMGLFGSEIMAIDSVKIRANNSRKNNHNAKTIKKTLAKTEERINQYLKLLEEADKNNGYDEENNLSSEQISEILTKLREKEKKYDGLQKQLEESGEKEISTVDGDSRLMKQGSQKALDVSYNTQTLTDEKHGMIADYETTNNAGDSGHLCEMTERTKKDLGVEELIVLGDTAYYDGKEILEAEKNHTTCLIPKGAAACQAKDKKYARENFIYNKEKDVYICPDGIELRYMRNQKDGSGDEAKIYANYHACGQCPNKGKDGKCTKSDRGREISRKVYQDALDEIDKRYRQNRLLYKKRQEIVEHPFGTIKWVWGFNRYLTRGKEKADAENALLFTAYNLRRAINIVGVKRLIEAIVSLFPHFHNKFLSFFGSRSNLQPIYLKMP